MPNFCQSQILSNDYYDILLEYSAYQEAILNFYPNTCIQPVAQSISIAYLDRSKVPPISNSTYGYNNIPKLYTPMDTSALEASGITRASNQPILNLRGQGVIIGFADTGIDYTHPAFLDESGKTRIVGIWDQTIEDGPAPEGLLYGSEYTQDMINAALQSDQPLSIVPSQDEDGHGTAIAGAAAGSSIPTNQFQGAAPEALIAMVKLKPAKQYLKDYYFINSDAIAWQENDILTAIKYLLDLRDKLKLPLVICLGMGSNQGGHSGCGILNEYLNAIGKGYRTAVVVPTGNEGSRFHHFRGNILSEGEYEDVEILVGENDDGFTAELWSSIPEIYSVGFVSPTGEIIERTPTRPRESVRIPFLLEETVIYMEYRLVNCQTGSQVIQIRFQKPAPGIWTIRVYKLQNNQQTYHIWLPVEAFLHNETVFLRPEASTTLTAPSATAGIISTAAYNHRTDSIYLYSGHGFTRLEGIRPTLAAPGVDITVPALRSGFTTRSGTSIAAAITAGAVASLFTWGITRENMPNLTGDLIQFYLVIGSRKNPQLQYPNREWGYGALDLYNVFETIRGILY